MEEDFSGLSDSHAKAKRGGEKYYFTGKPCKNGHIDKRYTCSARCLSCAKSEEVKKSEQKRHKRRYAEQAEHFKQYQKEYRANNPEKLRQRKSDYYYKNAEKIKSKVKSYREDNLEIVREKDREKYNNNKEYYLSKAAERRAIQIERTLNLSGELRTKNDEEVRKVYEEASFLSHSTGIPHEVDHILPLKGYEVSGLHVWYNLQVLPYKENHAKYNHLLEEYKYETFIEDGG